MTTQSEDKKIRILDSALKLFVEKGFHGTSTSAISKDAGVSAGILFHYFSSKNELVTELFLNIKTEFFKLLFDQVDNESFEKSLFSFWNSAVKWGLSNVFKFRFMAIYHYSPFYQEVKSNKSIISYEESLNNYFKTGINAGFFKDVSIELLKNNAFNLVVSFIDSLGSAGGFSEELSLQGWDCFKSSLIK